MKRAIKTLPLLFLFTAACTSISNKLSGSSAKSQVDSQLKVTSGLGHLKAKLILKNVSSRELVLSELNSRNFKVETVDGKPMPFKGQDSPAGEPLHLRPGQSAEMAFNLQDNYPFWDRRTKYKIWYESSDLKSNVVQVWF